MNHPTKRRTFLQAGAAVASLTLLDLPSLLAAENVPQSVADLWADFDPRQAPLEVEVIRQWREAGGIFRQVRFLIGTFKDKPARMAAIYGFPEGSTEKLPAVMHIHGGGQRAFLHEVKLLVERGYAALSVNWGGSAGGDSFNAPEGAQPGDPNTDWGAVDPSQLNVQGYQSILPGPKQFFEDREHPKNNNWYLLTLGCRRGLTFLEQQPEVDPQRLGVHGYSMGGNLTMYVAGSDDRVKAAVPGVGGAGWRWQQHRFIDGATQQDRIKGDVQLFARTLSFENYAPRIKCPLLHRSGTNDFHGWMDDVYRTNRLIKSQPTQYCFSPHLNHRLDPEVAVAMPLWFDQHLRGRPVLPGTPQSDLVLQTSDHVPLLRITPDATSLPVSRCRIYYSIDPDPRARFWRSADVVREGDAFVAKLPLHALEFPLFAFANVYHTLSQPVSLAAIPGYSKPVTEVCISSQLHSMAAIALKDAHVAVTLSPSALLDDFAHGLRDWYQLNAGNLTHQQTWTRKLTDPLFHGSDGAKLKLTLKMPETNSLSLVVQQNEWRDYRGPRRTFVCRREIQGSDETQSVTLAVADFTSSDVTLTSWSEIDQFGICAHFRNRDQPAEQPPGWQGPPLEFVRLEWT